MRIQTDRVKLETVIPLRTPYVLFIDPCNACNFKCKFCFQSQKMNRVKLSNHSFLMNLAFYKRIIDSLQDFEDKIKVIRLYGLGEPLINKSFPVMVEYAKKSSKVEKVDTTTNGSLLTEEYSKRIIDSGLDRINISINGVDSKQYDDFCDNSINFDVLVNNIEYFYKNKKQCHVFIKINGDYFNDEDKHKFEVIFRPISDEIAIEHTMNCWGLDLEVNKEVGLYGQPIQKIDVCPYIFYSMFIHSTGQVSACFLDWQEKLVIGDLFLKSIKEIWGDSFLKELQVKMLKKQRNEIPICNKCEQLAYGNVDNIDSYSEELLKKL